MEQLEKNKRRPRGLSARGRFEDAKAEAMKVIEAQRSADREKTQRLKAARLQSARGEVDVRA